MEASLDEARAALERVSSAYASTRADHEGTLHALTSRCAAAEAAAAEAARSVASSATRQASDAASRRALLAAAEEARVGMEAELWCLAAALEEKQRCVMKNPLPHLTRPATPTHNP